MIGFWKILIFGCVFIGVKFILCNYVVIGDCLFDSICIGVIICIVFGELLDEVCQFYEMGCCYYYYYVCNLLIQEQIIDNDIYQVVSCVLQNCFFDLMLSFGVSCNGSEVQENICCFGEWEWVSYCVILLYLGGVYFVMIQVVIELQVICELEK